jgi:hypothetical protein
MSQTATATGVSPITWFERLGEPFAQETGQTLDDFLARMRESRTSSP